MATPVALSPERLGSILASGVFAPALSWSSTLSDLYETYFSPEEAIRARELQGSMYKPDYDGLVVSDGLPADIVFYPEDKPVMTIPGGIAKPSLRFFRSLSFSEMRENYHVFPAFPHRMHSVPWPAYDPAYRARSLFAGPKPVISFMGVCARPEGRAATFEVLDALRRRGNVDVRVVERDTFAYADREAYVELMEQSDFVWCPDGVGSFSYRTYEALSLGRIPIIPLAGQMLPEVLPFDWRTMSVMWCSTGVGVMEAADNIEVQMAYFIGLNSAERIRRFWWTCLSPASWPTYVYPFIRGCAGETDV